MGHDTQPFPPMLPAREMCFTYRSVNAENELAVLEALCEGFTRANEMMISGSPDSYPCCNSCGGLHYSDPQPCFIRSGGSCKKAVNCQRVKGAYELVKSGFGTCIDLACFHAAIKRVKDGEDCWVVLDHELDASGRPIPNSYHAIVAFADGHQVDPSEMAKKNAASGFSCEGGCQGGDH